MGAHAYTSKVTLWLDPCLLLSPLPSFSSLFTLLYLRGPAHSLGSLTHSSRIAPIRWIDMQKSLISIELDDIIILLGIQVFWVQILYVHDDYHFRGCRIIRWEFSYVNFIVIRESSLSELQVDIYTWKQVDRIVYACLHNFIQIKFVISSKWRSIKTLVNISKLRNIIFFFKSKFLFGRILKKTMIEINKINLKKIIPRHSNSKH